MKERVRFIYNSPNKDYKMGEEGYLVGFCRGGNDVPFAVVRKDDGHYVLSYLHAIVYIGE